MAWCGSGQEDALSSTGFMGTLSAWQCGHMACTPCTPVRLGMNSK